MSGGELDALARLLPPGAVSVAEADRLAAGADLWPRHILRIWEGRTAALPLGVAWPESLEDVVRIVGFARERGLALVPYGAGSSVVGGATAGAGSLVVDLKRMAEIVDIDADALTATAGTGIMGELFERALARRGYTQGHFPSSIYCSSLGGWIAARGAGQMSSRYGKIEDQVLGGTVVLGDGSVVRQRPSPLRSALLDGLIGSEGTLGLWTEATVRIYPAPAARAFRGLELGALGDALELAEDWLRAGLSPAVVRIYDPVDTLLHRDTSSDEAPHERGPSRSAWAGAHLPRLLGAALDLVGRKSRVVVGLQGSEEAVARDERVLLELARRHRARDLGPGPGEAWWRTRYRVSYRQSNAFRAGVAVDTMEVACTWDRVLGLYEGVRRAGRKAGAQVLAHFSHVYLEGASIYFTYAIPASVGEDGYDRLWHSALAAALAHGGNVSHHHGIGRLKAGALEAALGGAVSLLRAQARALDPGGILNPGVLSKPERPTATLEQPERATVGSDHAGSEPVPGGSSPEADAISVRRLAEARARLPDAQPAPGALLATAAPAESAGAAESRLRRRGLTLGPVASALPDLSLLELARRGWLWHKSQQLHLVEPVVMGIDGDVAGEPFRYVPAPRAAMGSELWRALTEADVRRIWLRCAPMPSTALYVRGEPAACLALARAVARDEDLGSTQLAVVTSGGTAVVRLEVPAGPLAEDRQRALARRFGAAPRPEASAEPRSFGAIRPDSVLVTGPWRAVEKAVAEATEAGLGALLLLADGAGAAGFLGPAIGGAAWDRARAASIAARHGTDLAIERTTPGSVAELVRKPARAGGGQDAVEPSSDAASGTGSVVTPADRSGALALAGASQEQLRRAPGELPAGPPRRAEMPLVLAGHVHELDNCSYCPKLCRFSCPVAVSDGSETLTPRQLMLTASLDRRGARALDADTALRLYSCVDCRGCRSFCDHQNDVATTLMDARAELFEAGRAPDRVVAALAALATTGHLPGTTGFEPPPGDEGADTVVFFGCQGQAADDGLRRSTLELVRSRFGRARTLAGRRCCGLPSWRWGDREGFARSAAALAVALGGASRVVVDDPGCAYAMRELYPRVGVSVAPVVTVASLVGPGDVALDDPGTVAPHDDEWATRWLGEPTLRQRLDLPLARGSVLEGDAGSCGGSMLELYDPVLARRVARDCARDLLGGGAGRVLTASPTCRARLSAAGVEVVDVVELWAQKMARTPAVGST